MLSQLKTKLDGISKCSTNGHKVKNLFKILVNNLELWDMAHQSIASNKGATTRGVDDVTADGHSDERVLALRELLKSGRYQFQPVRRTYIPKANGKQRPLGIPNYHDKLVQSACKILLEAIYEPVFHEHSYGFRPKRSTHHALNQIERYWTGTKWFIEFDIKGYFDNINHNKLMEILSEKIDDNRFLALIRKMLRAGYMEDWTYNKTWSGTPQGGVISPILANIYLDKLDTHVQLLCSQNSYGREYRRPNKKYMVMCNTISRLKAKIRKGDYLQGLTKDAGEAKRNELLKTYRMKLQERMNVRAGDDFDESFRRLWYCRYADDFVLGYIGSREEATDIMGKIESFLKEELLLEVSPEKTKIENHKTGIRFLNHNIRTSGKEFFRKTVVTGAPTYQRHGGAKIHLYVPEDKVKDYCITKSYGNWHTMESKHRSNLADLSDAEILVKYNTELRGFFQYYKLTKDYPYMCWKLFTIADYSCRKTLGFKHKCSVKKISKRYVERTERGDKKLTVRVERNNRIYRIVKPNDINKSVSIDYDDTIVDYYFGRNDLTKRRKKEFCETCGVKTAFVEEHHVRALKDIRKSVKWWDRQMIARNRKTLILCNPCHEQIHTGTLPDMRLVNR